MTKHNLGFLKVHFKTNKILKYFSKIIKCTINYTIITMFQIIIFQKTNMWNNVYFYSINHMNLFTIMFNIEYTCSCMLNIFIVEDNGFVTSIKLLNQN